MSAMLMQMFDVAVVNSQTNNFAVLGYGLSLPEFVQLNIDCDLHAVTTEIVNPLDRLFDSPDPALFKRYYGDKQGDTSRHTFALMFVRSYWLEFEPEIVSKPDEALVITLRLPRLLSRLFSH